MDTKEQFQNELEHSFATNRYERSRHSHKEHRSHEPESRRHRNRANENVGRPRGDKSVAIHAPSNDGQVDGRVNERVAAVEIPEDSTWGETNTFLSETTDVTQLSHESLAKLTKDRVSTIGFHDCGFFATVIFASLSYLSPIAIVTLPYLWLPSNPFLQACQTSCKATFLGMVFKLVLLLIGSWAIFFRRQRTSMPRIFMFRTLVMFLMLLISVTYWLFYVIWVVEIQESDYEAIVEFANNFTTCLLFVHYLSLVLLELRQLQTTYLLEVIRNKDGERRFYNVGDLSIQRCSVWVLEKYYCDFPVYNPALMRMPSRSSTMKQLNKQTFKVYDVDGHPSNDSTGKNRAILAAVAKRRDAGHNERYYEEAEYERRVRKRKARLVAATEDAFTHIRRTTRTYPQDNSTMDPKQASEAIFPAFARSMQKYLRTTRQHQHYDIDNIVEHLSNCIKHNMTPKAFLERYLHPGPYLTYSPRHESCQWEIVSEEPLVNMIKAGSVIRLNQNEYSLIVTVHRLPRIRLKEEFVDQYSHRFVLQMQSETSL